MDRLQIIDDLLNELSLSEHAALKTIEQKNRDQLAKTVRYFRTQLPVYCQLTADCGARSSDVYDIATLPRLSKGTINRFGDELLVRTPDPPHQHVMRSHTSGSTGAPFLVHRSYYNILEWMAVALRDHIWHKRDVTLDECGIRGHQDEAIELDQWPEPFRLYFCTGRSRILPLGWDVKRLWSSALKFKPAYLDTFPSILVGMANQCVAEGVDPHWLSQISTYGEYLSEENRLHVSRVFGCDIVKYYSTEEFGRIASQCPYSDMLHINNAYLIVEVLNGDGAECADGEIGQVVVTDLRNRICPFIRYETGDWALIRDRCDCGLERRSIKQVFGRSRNLLRLPSGGTCWPRLSALFRRIPSGSTIKQFQMRQISINELHVNLVSDCYMPEAHAADIRRELELMTGENFVVLVKYSQDSIPREAGRKFEEFVREF